VNAVLEAKESDVSTALLEKYPVYLLAYSIIQRIALNYPSDKANVRSSLSDFILSFFSILFAPEHNSTGKRGKSQSSQLSSFAQDLPENASAALMSVFLDFLLKLSRSAKIYHRAAALDISLGFIEQYLFSVSNSSAQTDRYVSFILVEKILYVRGLRRSILSDYIMRWF
jgi:hypothetical protein